MKEAAHIWLIFAARVVSDGCNLFGLGNGRPLALEIRLPLTMHAADSRGLQPLDFS